MWTQIIEKEVFTNYRINIKKTHTVKLKQNTQLFETSQKSYTCKKKKQNNR